MYNNILDFKKAAIARNLCSGYTNTWDEARNKDDLVKMAIDANGISFMCNSIASGWGLSPEYINENFKYQINGNKIYEYINEKGNGYSSELLCCYGGVDGRRFEVRSTQICVINSKVILSVPSCSFVEVHAVDSEIEIVSGLKSFANVVIYGDNCHVKGGETSFYNLIKGKEE